jgi:hypothetical protein
MHAEEIVDTFFPARDEALFHLSGHVNYLNTGFLILILLKL